MNTEPRRNDNIVNLVNYKQKKQEEQRVTISGVMYDAIITDNGCKGCCAEFDIDLCLRLPCCDYNLDGQDFIFVFSNKESKPWT
jgi:hypothetical protein